MNLPTDSSGTGLIIDGIAADAKQQAEALITEARKIAQERLSFARQKADKIIAEANAKAEKQATSVRQTILSGINVALKREALHAQDAILKNIVEQATRKTEALLDTPKYPELLVTWIAEAAAGLGAPVAYVNASARERVVIDDKLLADAAGYTLKVYHHSVTLSLSPDNPLSGQGVVVTATNGRTAFNNQIGTRIRRSDRLIRNRVHETLFAPAGQGSATPKPTDQS